MARPRKTADEKRDQVVNMRVTLAEQEHLRSQAHAAGMSLGEYVRRRSLGHSVTPSPRQTDAALISEVNRIGVNVNQLAKAVHMNRVDPDFTRDWQYVLLEVRQVLAKLVTTDGP